MKRIMCVRLTDWPIDRFKRRRRPGRKPVALVDVTGDRQTVAAACPVARSNGVRVGMSRAEADALCGDLIIAAHEPIKDAKALDALGVWLTRFTPDVSPQPPDGIFLDVTGCERLFGGFDRLRSLVADALERLWIGGSVVVAPTPGAAYAVASSADRPEVVTEGQLWPALSPLSPGVLRIPSDTAESLHRLGIETIGQLSSISREALPVRFGNQLLNRLDQATGRVAEPLVFLKHHTPVTAAMRFDGAIDSLEAIWAVLQRLVAKVVDELGRRGRGARRMVVRFDRDGRPAIEQSVVLSRPSRDAANLFRLLRCASEAVRTDDGFTAISLAVPVFEPVVQGQRWLVGQDDRDAADEFDGLIERLHARLGEHAVETVEPVEAHLPEKACRYVEAISGRRQEIRPDEDPDARPPVAPRPMRLLTTPVEVGVTVTPSQDRDGRPVSFTHGRDVHRLAYAIGPERIGGRWWDGHHKTRDYFEVEDQVGRCFWLFRVNQSGRWFLHGHFA